MSPDISFLWNLFSKELGWGASIESRIIFDFLINAREFSKGKVILDAGAGHQRYKPFFDTSIYISQEHPAGIEFKKMQGIEYDLISPLDEIIPLKKDSISTVICTSVVEHVRFPERFFNESHRVLQPGGRFYINVPFTYHEHEVPYDFQRPARYGLQAWLRSAGFKKISVLPSCNSFTRASSFVMTFLYEDLMQRNLIQKYKEIAPFVKNCLDSVNSSLDDYVDSEAIFPVGWIAIAEKEGILKNEAPLQKSEVVKNILN